jgi:DNA-binding MarR family transcriptional regulator
MRNSREIQQKQTRQKAGPRAGTHPCASKSPRHRLVELLWSFSPAFQRWSESLMTERKISPQRLRILGSLHDRGPRIMCDLKEELGVTATNITALVDSLEADGLVLRRKHPTDRRATVIELSAKAKGELALGCTEYKDRVAELFSGLSEAECREFSRVLEKLWARLQG